MFGKAQRAHIQITTNPSLLGGMKSSESASAARLRGEDEEGDDDDNEDDERDDDDDEEEEEGGSEGIESSSDHWSCSAGCNSTFTEGTTTRGADTCARLDCFDAAGEIAKDGKAWAGDPSGACLI